jgi:hypothetical protein
MIGTDDAPSGMFPGAGVLMVVNVYGIVHYIDCWFVWRLAFGGAMIYCEWDGCIAALSTMFHFSMPTGTSTVSTGTGKY